MMTGVGRWVASVRRRKAYQLPRKQSWSTDLSVGKLFYGIKIRRRNHASAR